MSSMSFAGRFHLSYFLYFKHAHLYFRYVLFTILTIVSAYILRVLFSSSSVHTSFNGDEEEEFRRELQRKGLNAYNYCIVMPAAQRNLHQILSQENVAGKDWEAIKRMAADILRCVDHLHRHFVIHGDLKPLNIMRNNKGKLILIDLDASRAFGCGDFAGRKFSSAFCPPEAVGVDPATGTLRVKFAMSQPIKLTEAVETLGAAAAIEGASEVAESVAAGADWADFAYLSASSFDMWAVGATLYQMCSGEPLFLSSYDNSLDDEGDLSLFRSSSQLSLLKLSQIIELDVELDVMDNIW